MRALTLRSVVVGVVAAGMAAPAVADPPRDVVHHDCTIAVYTSARRQLELRRRRGEAVSAHALANASDTPVPMTDKAWRGTMVWPDDLQYRFPFGNGVLVLSGWYDGAGRVYWVDRETAPVGFRVWTDEHGRGGTPIGRWLPPEAVSFTIEITDPAYALTAPPRRGSFASVQSSGSEPRPRAGPGQVEPPRPDEASEKARDQGGGGGIAGGVAGGVAGGLTVGGLVAGAGAGVTTAGEVIVVGTGLLGLAKAIIGAAAAGGAVGTAAGAGAGSAKDAAEAVERLLDKGKDYLHDGVDIARDEIRKRILRDGTKRSKDATGQLAGHRDYRALPAPTREGLALYVSDHVRRHALEAIGDQLQRVIETTDANIARLAELAQVPGNLAARAALAHLQRDRAVYQLILDEQQRALSGLRPIALTLREAPPAWRSYPKHLPAQRLLDQGPAALAEATRGAPALYLRPEQVQQLETAAWERGATTSAGHTKYRVWRFDDVIGASDGQLTRCVKVEVTAGVLHGHPVPEHECDSVLGGTR